MESENKREDREFCFCFNLSHILALGGVLIFSLFISFLFGVKIGKKKGIDYALNFYARETTRIEAPRAVFPESTEGRDIRMTDKMLDSLSGNRQYAPTASKDALTKEISAGFSAKRAGGRFKDSANFRARLSAKDLDTTTSLLKGWYVQIGTYRNKSEARKIKMRLEKVRELELIVQSATLRGKTIYRVLLGPYKTKSMAESFLTKIRRETGKDRSFVREVS